MNGVAFEFGLQRGDLDVPVEPYFNADAATQLAGFYGPLATIRSLHDRRLKPFGLIFRNSLGLDGATIEFSS